MRPPCAQVSGYIDYGARLAAGCMDPVFERRRRLLPRPGDLSYYNWVTHVATSDPSVNFQVRPLLGEGRAGRSWRMAARAASARRPHPIGRRRRSPRLVRGSREPCGAMQSAAPLHFARRSAPCAEPQVVADDVSGLQFKCKRDRKVVSVDPARPPGDNSCRTELGAHEYTQVVLFDHVTRRRG